MMCQWFFVAEVACHEDCISIRERRACECCKHVVVNPVVALGFAVCSLKWWFSGFEFCLDMWICIC